MEGANVASNQIAERILRAESVHRLQAPLSGPGFHVTSSIDDWSEQNIANLRRTAAHYVSQRATPDAVVAQLTIGASVT